MHKISTSGGQLHYHDSGPSHHPAMVFINSLGTDLRLWDQVVTQLSETWRCIRWDKRGHGLSTPRQLGPITIAEHSDDMLAILDHLGIDRAAVVGISIGGMIAMDFAHRFPDRISATVLACTGTRIGSAEMWEERIRNVTAGGVESIADAILARWLPSTFREKFPSEVAAWRALLCATTANGYAASCAAIRDADLACAARAIACPTLCIAGELDPVTPPALVNQLHQLIPQSEFTTIPASGHLPPIDAPTVFASTVHEFANRAGN